MSEQARTVYDKPTTCPRCFRTSYSRGDIEHKFCSACKLYYGEPVQMEGRQFTCIGCQTPMVAIIHAEDIPTCGMCWWLARSVNAGEFSRDIALQIRQLLRAKEATVGREH